jgi:hypothetical protein
MQESRAGLQRASGSSGSPKTSPDFHADGHNLDTLHGSPRCGFPMPLAPLSLAAGGFSLGPPGTWESAPGFGTPLAASGVVRDPEPRQGWQAPTCPIPGGYCGISPDE